jgi:hypothetical protein
LPQIKQVYELAQIEYGRIDYGLVNGKIQVFEINTHPMLLNHKRKVPLDRQERTRCMAANISKAFNSLVPVNEPVQPLLQFKPSPLKKHVHVSRDSK